MIIKSKEERNSFRNIVLNHLGDEEIFAFHLDIEDLAFSNKGRVKNVVTGNFLKTSKNSNGYAGLNVTFNSKGRRFAFLHRIILEVFLGHLGWENYFYETNHIDGNKENNNLNNLEWLTRKENLDHSRTTRLVKKSAPRKVQDGDIIDIVELYKLGFSTKEIAKSYGLSEGWTCRLAHGRARKQEEKEVK